MIKRFFLSVILYLLMVSFSFAGSILNSPMFQAFDDNGDPLTGGLLYSYIAGTTTAKALYTDKACTTPDTNPVVLDSRGEAEIYGTVGGYKLVLKTAADVTIWTIDSLDISSYNETYYYFPDSSQTDQGAATGGGASTVKDFVDSIGTSKKATIILIHTGASNTTTYTLTTHETIPSNIKLQIEIGAILDGAGTLTINGPFIFGDYQVFGSSITIAGSPKLDSINPEWWYSGTGSATSAIQAAINLGKKVLINKLYTVSTGFTMATKGQILQGVSRDTSGFISDNAITILTIQTSRYITIKDLLFDGNDVGLTGVAGTFPKGVIQNCEFRDFATSGVNLGAASFSWRITDNSFIGNTLAGLVLSVGGANNDTHILNNIFQSNGSYGIDIQTTPSYSDSIYIKNNNFENNAAAGSVGTPYSHILVGGGTGNVFTINNHFESDNSQTGFASQLFMEIGAGSENIHIKDNFMNVSSVQKLDYLIKLNASSSPVKISGNHLKNFNVSAIKNELGTSGLLELGTNTTEYANEENIVDQSGFEVILSSTSGLTRNYGHIVLLKKTVAVTGATNRYTVSDVVPTGSEFIPVSALVRTNNIITATTGDYLGLGSNAADRRVDYGFSSAAASSQFAKNTKILFLNAPNKDNQALVSAEPLQLMAVDSQADSAVLANNYGGADEYVTVICTGWLIKELPDI